MAPENCQKESPVCVETSSKSGALEGATAVPDGLHEDRTHNETKNTHHLTRSSIPQTIYSVNGIDGTDDCPYSVWGISMQSGVRAVSVLAALVIWSCAGPVEVAPVPTPSLEGVAPEVREAVLAAHGQAVAEPENGQASGRLGMVLQANTLYPAAALAYQRAVQLEPDDFVWQYYLALTLQEMSKLEEAVDTLSAALQIRPDYAPAIIKRGELLFELGRFEESSATLESALELSPGSAEALYTLARVKYAQGELSAAENLYRRARVAYPTYGAAHYGLAMTEKRLGHDAEAATGFELAERYKGDAPKGGDPLLDQVSNLRTGLLSRVKRAQQMIRDGELREASRLLQEVVRQDPSNLDALLNLLFLGPVEGQPSGEEMEAFYERARQIAPQDPNVHLYYAMTLANSGRDEAAVTTLNRALEIRPDYAEAHTLLGRVLEKRNRPAEAIQHYRLALEAQPSYRPAQLQLAQTLYNQGRYREAIPELHHVLEVEDSNTSLTMVFLARAYANTGEEGKAREYLRHAQARVANTGPPDLMDQIEQGLRQLSAHP